MNNITIRKAVLKDLNALLDFEQGIINFERPFDITLDEDPISYYDIKAMITAIDVEVVVAVCNDEIVGSGYARIETSKPYLKHNKFAYLGFMFVKPNYRGKGVIQLVIKTLKAWSNSKGIDEIRLDVYSENSGAIKAYEKAGFVPILTNMRLHLNSDD